MNPAITAPAPSVPASPVAAPWVAVTGSGPASARVLDWLTGATTNGRPRFRTRPWNPGPAGGSLDEMELVVSWLENADEAEALLERLPSQVTWIVVSALQQQESSALAERARAADIDFVYAPLRQDPAVLTEGARTPVLAYQRPCEGTRSPAYLVLTALSAHIAWMGALR